MNFFAPAVEPLTGSLPRHFSNPIFQLQIFSESLLSVHYTQESLLVPLTTERTFSERMVLTMKDNGCLLAGRLQTYPGLGKGGDILWLLLVLAN